MSAAIFGAADLELLLELLALPTAGPLEHPDGPPPRLWEAGRRIAAHAERFGFRIERHAAAEPAWLHRPGVPEIVRQAAAVRPDFLSSQPNLVLRWGSRAPVERTLMFNVHLDTVADVPTPRVDGTRVYGRGAIDAKGPAVALLAGLRNALAPLDSERPELCVLVQLVAGEEGGAMGVFGTRPLVADGYVGRINIFCEPTGGRLLPRSTAAMTARIRVRGEDAIDDHPEAGHNASVLLGYLAHRLAQTQPEWAARARVCIAGLHTGRLHNRVYGSGDLLLNIAYRDAAVADRVRTALETRCAAAAAEFAELYVNNPAMARTADAAASLVGVDWLKSGLPTLNSIDPWAEEIVAGRGPAAVPWAAPDEEGFTCDAIWMGEVPGTYTVVFGPGDLDRNRAHAAGEFADLGDLDHYAAQIGALVGRFAAAPTGLE
ncbi:M20/M25/M40 family metallo-hydrolase [Nocardia sp. CDC159]|uniref:M20/M25/M40 family metallo-hydrolase n=1 Tax=Nocardia pulmonis TaxID=2951408 RepID=A0A9X2E4Y5_9NOCA|nr:MULTISPECIES: M20/M25/M40 family metallo-hydrolase [Nocardia]MCM6773148.1 M20/M25/M40 family metallo-hydrolase [Nocardia pulmonis]MCM6785549.1 M20/M25/M40 family metallo-hydrolase [Nocardia sp. CDC159]